MFVPQASTTTLFIISVHRFSPSSGLFVRLHIVIVAFIVFSLILLRFSKLMKMTPSNSRRKHLKTSKKKRSSKSKNAVAKPVDEEEVVWFSNPSKEAARARREEAKDIMGRELWSTIMEDSSDEDDDEEDEKFYFYAGGWHSSPQPQIHLESTNKGESSHQEEVDSQGCEIGEDCSPKGMVSLEIETDKPLANRSDVNDANDERNGLESVEDAPKSDRVVVNIEIPHDKDSSKRPEPVEIAKEKESRMVVASLERADTQEQQRGLHILIQIDDDDVAVDVSNDADIMEPRMTETKTKSDTVVEIEEAEEAVCRMADASNQLVSVSIIESVSESSRKHSSGGFKHKIRGWIGYVARKIRGWAAKLRQTLCPCCINAHTAQATQSS